MAAPFDLVLRTSSGRSRRGRSRAAMSVLRGRGAREGMLLPSRICGPGFAPPSSTTRSAEKPAWLLAALQPDGHRDTEPHAVAVEIAENDHQDSLRGVVRDLCSLS